MQSLVVCGVFAGGGAVLLFVRSQADSLLYRLCGLFAVVASTMYAVVIGRELLAEGVPVWNPVVEYLVGLAVMPGAALVGTMQYRRRQRKGL
ncbi:TPA: hypothetical protein DCL30_01045 [Candidatus Peribacteria bacterium]|nr:MAG: hypothetical protein A3J91_02940 [Candidatus Peribacteria bacterium RIFOXYC2_FULL_58_10]OGJ85148.1 MAG: hypothetical protein A2529_01645 [Candidatus Peribacteria bacterium RIFOXYD2_FULL_58_15]HAI98114.1 hypothetical protein [Candidatus Peribacteria bacterium]HAS33845.1 hypothetical protein [Candidatus Peribacteria bacterium]